MLAVGVVHTSCGMAFLPSRISSPAYWGTTLAFQASCSTTQGWRRNWNIVEVSLRNLMAVILGHDADSLCSALSTSIRQERWKSQTLPSKLINRQALAVWRVVCALKLTELIVFGLLALQDVGQCIKFICLADNTPRMSTGLCDYNKKCLIIEIWTVWKYILSLQKLHRTYSHGSIRRGSIHEIYFLRYLHCDSARFAGLQYFHERDCPHALVRAHQDWVLYRSLAPPVRFFLQSSRLRAASGTPAWW